MSMLNPDPLYPIFDKNRDELLLIEYEGFIKHITEGIVISMLLTRQKWINKYPKIKEFNNFFNGEVYDKVLLYNNPVDYLKGLSNNTLEDEDIIKDIEELKCIDTLSLQQFTIFEFAIRTLIKEKFIKKCIFIKSSVFNDNELSYLLNIFKDDISKISIVSGSTEEAFSEHKPTTCFANSLEVINKCIEVGNGLGMKDRLFVLRNNRDTVYYSEEDKLFHYHTEFINKIEDINKGKVFYIAPMYSFRQEGRNNKESMG